VDEKEFVSKATKKQSWREEPRASNRYLMVSGLSGKPTYVDIPNDVVAWMKKMDPQQVANILLKK